MCHEGLAVLFLKRSISYGLPGSDTLTDLKQTGGVCIAPISQFDAGGILMFSNELRPFMYHIGTMNEHNR